MPFAVSMVVNLLIAPAPRRLAERALARRLALCAAMLTGPSPAQRDAFAELEREGTAEIDGLLHLAGLEGTSPAADLAALRQASRSTLAIVATTALIDREPARCAAATAAAGNGGHAGSNGRDPAPRPLSGRDRAAARGRGCAVAARGASLRAAARGDHRLRRPRSRPASPQRMPRQAAASSCPTPSPIPTMSVTRSRPPRRRCSATSSIRCSTGRASIPA